MDVKHGRWCAWAMALVVLVGGSAVAAEETEKEVAAATAKLAKDQVALQAALAGFATDVGRPPTEVEGLRAFLENPAVDDLGKTWKGPYLKDPEALRDYWGRLYVYLPATLKKTKTLELVIWSTGPDGKPYTKDDVAVGFERYVSPTEGKPKGVVVIQEESVPPPKDPQTVKAIEKLRDDMAYLQKGIAKFEIDCARAPTREEGLDALLKKPESKDVADTWEGPYSKDQAAFKDTWGKPYVFLPVVRREDLKTEPAIWSAGKDAKPYTQDDLFVAFRRYYPPTEGTPEAVKKAHAKK